jgi:hypothetical protein
MALTPINPPAGGAATAQTVAGTARDYISSGTCSGTAFTHEQRLTVAYTLTTRVDPNGAWLPGSNTVSGLSLTVYANVNGTRGDFSTSANVSGCTNAANMRQDQIFDISSTTTATAGALGTAGMITTASAGTFRRWANSSDVDFYDTGNFQRVWFPLEGMPAGFNNNADLSKVVLRQLISQILDGGLHYSNDGTAASVASVPTQTRFDRTLIRI